MWLTFSISIFIASPANSKLAHRMTTLHEEMSLRNIPLQEENEDSYSDPEYDYDSKQPSSASANDYYAKSRMRSSHTIDSFMDIEKKTSTTSTNLLNYKLLTQHQPFHVQQTTLTTTMAASSKPQEKSLKNGKLESVIAGSSPSMNSSTSSGYGSQAVSISNLTNEDTLSLQSMSVDENTPGEKKMFFRYFSSKFNNGKFFRADFQSSSPPRKDATAIYTPSSGQKRFNPFMKDNGSSNSMGKNQDDDSRTNTSPTHKQPLTPTKDHPLMDLVNARAPRGEFMDSDSDENVNMVVVEKDDAVVDFVDKKIKHEEVDVELYVENNNIENSQISTPPPPSSQPVGTESDQILTTSTLKNFDDEKNNNTRVDMNESDDEAEKQQKLAVDKVVRRKKSPSRVNNNNIKNNNRMSYPMGRSEVVMTKSSDKIDGRSCESSTRKTS